MKSNLQFYLIVFLAYSGLMMLFPEKRIFFTLVLCIPLFSILTGVLLACIVYGVHYLINKK